MLKKITKMFHNFITEFGRFGKRLKHYKWIFENKLITSIIMIVFLCGMIQIAGITITVVTALVALVKQLL